MSTAQRRRGAALEEALVDAAWAELGRSGYDGFTIDAVAKAAGTSRAVLYRRWPNRAALVHAAVRAHLGSIADLVPDTGELRQDVLVTLQTITDRVGLVGVDVMTGLLSELAELPEALATTVPDVFGRLVARAAERGEIGPGHVPEPVLRMPGDLVRYEMITTREAPGTERLRALVDELFLPLVHHHAGDRDLKSRS
ncbi:TetR/AcrR family transcriptional regulator [Amycolatopsis rhabdoformis]|uniref:TetR/AcrR family transcriptional regulator n=1 Tax=Amycolatopsis rhabdoformis TaxID=1448059 RepID=A0ABZ1I3T0_9PSEU|nr:TetR/AcrR family transcriptional regulator [Amycolatopsis rhabdoformis]WSE29071.1 TetR/AcrR family transcriptional regulator [Amycolatopsis rhabdoformis]